MNNKAQLGNQTMIFSWILLLIIIAGSIVAGLSLFFGASYDFKKVDSEILNTRITTCLETHQTVLQIPEELFTLCKLNKKSIEKNFLITINGKKYTKGDTTQCALYDKNKEYPHCTDSTITINNEEYLITAGSNQEIRRQLS